jgi:trehalose synthase
VAGPVRITLDDYRTVAPRGAVEFVMRLAETVRGRHLVHVTASRYGGGVAATLNRTLPVLNALGVETTWEIVVGTAEFDASARTLALALYGTEQVVTEAMLERLYATCVDNAARLPLAGDLVMIHGSAPFLLVDRRPDAGRWAWRGHGDMSAPQAQVWAFLRRFLPRYDAAVISRPSFAPPLPIPRFLIAPSVDPLAERNRDMSRLEQAQRLDRLAVPRDKPYLLQVGDFTRTQDPQGVINAYRLVKKRHDVRLVLAGPEPAGTTVLDEVREAAQADPDLLPLVLAGDSDADLNALERGATIVVQKPLRADFALDVACAMWKGKPVIGSPAGGIPFQIPQGVTGYVVETVEGAAFRIRHLLNNPELIGRMGAAGREHVRRHFLLTQQLASYLALLAHLTG